MQGPGSRPLAEAGTSSDLPCGLETEATTVAGVKRTSCHLLFPEPRQSALLYVVEFRVSSPCCILFTTSVGRYSRGCRQSRTSNLYQNHCNVFATLPLSKYTQSQRSSLGSPGGGRVRELLDYSPLLYTMKARLVSSDSR